jgi:low temperature requirement protein LtrA
VRSYASVTPTVLRERAPGESPEVTNVALFFDLFYVFAVTHALVMSAAHPRAFGSHAVVFAAAYVALQTVPSAFLVVAFRGQRMGRNYAQLLAWSVGAGAVWRRPLPRGRSPSPGPERRCPGVKHQDMSAQAKCPGLQAVLA